MIAVRAIDEHRRDRAHNQFICPALPHSLRSIESKFVSVPHFLLIPSLLSSSYSFTLSKLLTHITANMVKSAVLGFPRMGRLRELKKANEAYWAGSLSRDDLLAEGKRLRLEHWKIQKDAGVDIIPSNDFAFYDHVLDHIQFFNAVPPRYSQSKLEPIDEYFAMGRGHQKDGIDVPSLEMVKWFDSNYHYVKPTFQDGQTFKLAENPKPIVHFKEAKEAGIVTRPVLRRPRLFPCTLGKADRDQSVDPISLLDKLAARLRGAFARAEEGWCRDRPDR